MYEWIGSLPLVFELMAPRRSQIEQLEQLFALFDVAAVDFLIHCHCSTRKPFVFVVQFVSLHSCHDRDV